MDRLWMLLHTFKQTFRGPSSFVKSKTCYVISIAFLSFLTSFCCLYRCLSLKESPPVTGSMRKRERAGERPQPSTGLHRLGASLVIGKISSLRLSEQFLVFALRSLHNRDKREREREREREKLVIVRHSTLPLLALPSESRALYTSWYLYRNFPRYVLTYSFSSFYAVVRVSTDFSGRGNFIFPTSAPDSRAAFTRYFSFAVTLFSIWRCGENNRLRLPGAL